MAGKTELLTVYRSADMDAEEDAQAVHALLLNAGLHPHLLTDDAPGVVEGTFEIRVPPAEAQEAEALIAKSRVDEPEEEDIDPSHDLDLVTVAKTDGTTAELEATSIKSILNANGIRAVIVGATSMPNLGFEVRVTREDARRAEEVILEARAAGPSAALEAEEQQEAEAKG
jgi:hypothetical protein